MGSQSEGNLRNPYFVTERTNSARLLQTQLAGLPLPRLFYSCWPYSSSQGQQRRKRLLPPVGVSVFYSGGVEPTKMQHGEMGRILVGRPG